MSRKKLNSLLALLLLSMYLICLGISWRACVSYVYNDFYFTANSFKENYVGNLSKLCDGASYTSADGFTFKNSSCFDWLSAELSGSYMPYPFSMVVYDEHGQIIAKSDVMLSVHKYDEIQIINLGDYLKAETRKQLIDILNDKNIYELRGIDCYEKDGKSIPVELYFETFSENCDKLKSLKITDNKVTNTYYNENDSDYILELSTYNLFSSNTDKSVCDQLFKEISCEDMKNKAIDAMKKYIGGGGYKGNDMVSNFDILELDASKYYLYYQIDYNLFEKVITSNVFKALITSQLTIFSIITFAAFLIANKIYTKNKNMTEAKYAFISAAAHELKTPIAAIQNNSECVIENVNPDKNEHYISTIHDESIRMSSLVAKLLQYNRLANVTKVEKSLFSLTDVVNREIREYNSLFEAKQLRVTLAIAEDILVNANEDLIALAVDNYISNALKYTKQGGAITVNLEKIGKGIRFSVFNECDGIDCPDKDRLWDVLYRTDKVRNSADNASGLGLAICKKIFEMHSYSYGYSNKQNGVEFYFSTTKPKLK